jgi:glyoxylase-like metal-dependent hydrolase (beta-lactamase superfamily II)
MEHWICKTCGTQFLASVQPPRHCPICTDARQYVGHEGQQWTTLASLQEEGHHNIFRQHEHSLLGIGAEPQFAIGQRALLVQTSEGNVLWDCIAYLDDGTVHAIKDRGGIQAIVISHPHYYTTMVEWAERFNAPIYLHEADRAWVLRPDERITFWSGETLPLFAGITVVRLGGHFPGSTVLHWPAGAEGQGALLSGDTITVVADHKWVSFMYSYPNMLPLPAAEVRRIRDAITPYRFDRLYGAWFDKVVGQDANAVVRRSADRYIQALEQEL